MVAPYQMEDKWDAGAEAAPQALSEACVLAQPFLLLVFILIHALQNKLAQVVQQSRLANARSAQQKLEVLITLIPADRQDVAMPQLLSTGIDTCVSMKSRRGVSQGQQLSAGGRELLTLRCELL